MKYQHCVYGPVGQWPKPDLFGQLGCDWSALFPAGAPSWRDTEQRVLV